MCRGYPFVDVALRNEIYVIMNKINNGVSFSLTL